MTRSGARNTSPSETPRRRSASAPRSSTGIARFEKPPPAAGSLSPHHPHESDTVIADGGRVEIRCFRPAERTHASNEPFTEPAGTEQREDVGRVETGAGATRLSYFIGTRLRSSSNQFTTISMCMSAPLGRNSVRKCLPSGATSHVVPTRCLKSSCGMPA